MQSKIIWTTDGNANGVAISPDGKTLYIPDTGVSNFRPSNKNPYGKRMLWAFDISGSGAVLANKRMLGNPLSYFYDGIRASREGWLFAGSGDAVDVIDPETGFVLGSIRVGGGSNVAVSLAFGEHEMWIVGKGGVWHVKNIKARLMRDW
jgi:gluconolactonase